MADDIKDFLDQVKTNVEAVSGIIAVYITPGIDLDRVMQIPQFPMVLINDGGGELSEFNGKLWTRRLELTVVNHAPRDHVGEEATRLLLDLGESIVAALEYDDDDAVYLVGDSDIEAAPYGGTGTVIVSKTYAFSYQIQRS